MKIDKPGKPLPNTPTGEAAGHAATRGKSTTPPSAPQQSGSTSVSLGSITTKLNSMTDSMASTPVVDAGKVTEIKLALSEGRFKVNSGVVADRLIQTVRDLIGGKA